MQRYEISSEDGRTLETLGDDARMANPREIILAPAPLDEIRRAVQVAEFTRATRAQAWGRGNGIVTFSWTVARYFSTISDAIRFRRDHPLRIPALGKCTLRITEFGNTSVSIGALEGIRIVDRIGPRIVHQYTWVGTELKAS